MNIIAISAGFVFRSIGRRETTVHPRRSADSKYLHYFGRLWGPRWRQRRGFSFPAKINDLICAVATEPALFEPNDIDKTDIDAVQCPFPFHVWTIVVSLIVGGKIDYN